jgi:pimeloyl-ACP methyl ester carboxylesterase
VIVSRARTALAVLTLAVLTACTSTLHGHGSRSPAPDSAGTTSSAPSGTAGPGGPAQPRADFGGCAAVGDLSRVPLPGDRAGKLEFSCAQIKVPLDYGHPDDKKITLQLLKVHYRGASPIGALVMNPGGPGASGVLEAVGLVTQQEYSLSLLQHFDLVGFDPRGVYLSTPIECFGDTADRDRLNGLSPDILTPSGFAQAKQTARENAQRCNSKYGSDLQYFDTVNTARDLDQIRQAVGDAKLNYLGFSYGTELGSVYAHLYPGNIRVAVLDGAVDPLTDDITSFADQLKGFEGSFDQFAAWCATHNPCSKLGNPRQLVYRLVATAQKHPIPTTVSGDDRRATPSYVLTGVLSALYSKSTWPQLAAGLRSAKGGDAGGLLALADQYNERYNDNYTNIADANTAISCNDSEPGPSDATIRATAAKWAREFPMFGLESAPALFSCQQWQPHRTPPPLPKAATHTPVLVIGNLHDPATPYQGAIDLARTMGNAEVLTWDGEGHTSFLQGSSCIDSDVENYLIEEHLPPEHTTCKP